MTTTILYIVFLAIAIVALFAFAIIKGSETFEPDPDAWKHDGVEHEWWHAN